MNINYVGVCVRVRVCVCANASSSSSSSSSLSTAQEGNGNVLTPAVTRILILLDQYVRNITVMDAKGLAYHYEEVCARDEGQCFTDPLLEILQVRLMYPQTVYRCHSKHAHTCTSLLLPLLDITSRVVRITSNNNNIIIYFIKYIGTSIIVRGASLHIIKIHKTVCYKIRRILIFLNT